MPSARGFSRTFAQEFIAELKNEYGDVANEFRQYMQDSIIPAVNSFTETANAFKETANAFKETANAFKVAAYAVTGVSILATLYMAKLLYLS
jgi:hypothetical protein